MFLIDPYRYAGAAVATTTWDPADKSASVTLSNGNLTAANPDGSNAGYVRGTTSRASGTYHFEITIGGVNSSTGISIGVAPVGSGSSSLGLRFTANGADIVSDGGSVGTLNGGSVTATTVVAVEVNATSGEVWLQRQGQSRQGPFTSASFPTSAMEPYVGLTRNTGTQNAITANFGQSAFAVAPTSGFLAWG